MCDISDSIPINKEDDFSNITDDTEDIDSLNASLSTSAANADETNHSLYSNQVFIQIYSNHRLYSN